MIAQMQKIPAYLCLAQLIGRAPVERGKTANALQIDLLGRGCQPGGRHVCDHSLTQLTHRGLPPFEPARTPVPAPEGIPSITPPRERASLYGEAVQSNTCYVEHEIMHSRVGMPLARLSEFTDLLGIISVLSALTSRRDQHDHHITVVI
jgi:hypothetical protein